MSYFDLKIETKTKLNQLQTDLMEIWHRSVSQKEVVEKLIDTWSFSKQTWKILRRIQMKQLNNGKNMQSEKDIIESVLLEIDKSMREEEK